MNALTYNTPKTMGRAKMRHITLYSSRGDLLTRLNDAFSLAL